MTPRKALALLQQYNVEPEIIRHLINVSRLATAVAAHMIAQKPELDVNLVTTGALLHDIGRTKTHSLTHGLEGYKLLLPIDSALALIAKHHIGAGITKDEAPHLGLPEEDLIPTTLEEKIVAFADNCVFNDEFRLPHIALKRFEQELGKNHPAIKRIGQLNKEIIGLLDTGVENVFGQAKFMETLPGDLGKSVV